MHGIESQEIKEVVNSNKINRKVENLDCHRDRYPHGSEINRQRLEPIVR